ADTRGASLHDLPEGRDAPVMYPASSPERAAHDGSRPPCRPGALEARSERGGSGNRVERREVAGGPGFEPGFSESESDVLPLDDPPAALRAYPVSAAGCHRIGSETAGARRTRTSGRANRKHDARRGGPAARGAHRIS